jgi:hypothetical protein
MFKGKAKTRIVLDGKMYQVGSPVELTKEQYAVLKDYLSDAVEVKPSSKKETEQKESVKAKKPSTRGKAKKAE